MSNQMPEPHIHDFTGTKDDIISREFEEFDPEKHEKMKFDPMIPGLLSDKTIKVLVEEGKLGIEPFFPHQVKDEDGKKVISYGLTSFGYDIRVADEFKIFTNVNSTVVDPKNFDPKVFVDHKGPYCIIPPNSFALARTVERFKIPRDVLTVCLGKSTLARCFSGDTKVALANGTSATFLELVERAKKGERIFGYSVNLEGKITVTEFIEPRKVGTEETLEVVLDNGEVISCTPDHKFMLKDGSYKEAKDLVDGESLWPLYRKLFRGYEAVLQFPHYNFHPTHRLSDQWNLRNGIYEAVENTHRHHKDHNKLNNYPTNIERKNASDHIRDHNEEMFADPEFRAWLSRRRAETFKKQSKDPNWYAAFCERSRQAADKFWHDEDFEEERAAWSLARKEYWANMTPEEKERRTENFRKYATSDQGRRRASETLLELWKDPEFIEVKRAHACELKIRHDVTEEKVLEALKATGTLRGAARMLDVDRTAFRRFPEIIAKFKSERQSAKLDEATILFYLNQTGSIQETSAILKVLPEDLLKFDVVTNYEGLNISNNHKVVTVRKTKKVQDVYCLTVPEFGNFALEAGVFVKNCGIIVNVTPFEPEWEGYVTLEFSNTTPLPAKIYANEGCAQVLFFRGDRECEVSYKDRGGKYMNQAAEVVTPRLKED